MVRLHLRIQPVNREQRTYRITINSKEDQPMITEQYVTFETARMLKEAGFDALCNSMYTDNGFGWSDLDKVNYNEYETSYSRPTQSLAAKWLREVHNIDVVVDIANEKEYYCDIYQNTQRKSIAESINPSFEETLEDGLKYGLKLIKK